MNSDPIRCTYCGRFIAYKDLEEETASFIMTLPESAYSVETWVGTCKACNQKMIDNPSCFSYSKLN